MPLVLRPVTGDIEQDNVASFAYVGDKLSEGLGVAPWQCCLGGTGFIAEFNSYDLTSMLNWVISECEVRNLDQVLLDLPPSGVDGFDTRQFAITLGEVVLAHDWTNSPIREIFVYSFKQVDHETVNGYYQGYWHI
jgi:hypothetical protein